MKVLVLGSNGQLGRCLNDQLSNTDHEVVYTSREQIDIVNFEATRGRLHEINPDIVINASAYTAVDKAEDDKDQANLVNHLAVSNIAEICHHLNCWFIHVSTDYVFDGSASEPYNEKSKTNPQGVYGFTKLSGEHAIKKSGCNFIIIRTSWVFSEYGNNFLKTMLRLGLELKELKIVGDQFGCPTYARDIANSIISILTPIEKGNAKCEIYNFCGDKASSWFLFAEEIFQKAKKIGILKKIPKIIEVSSSEFPTKASRPKYSVMTCEKLENDWGIKPSFWSDGVTQSLKRLMK